MKYPNLRYGHPNDLLFYMQGRTVRDIAKRLRRSERTIRNYLDYSEKMPWWVPEILRLSAMEAEHRAYQMNMRPVMVRMGIPQPDATVYEFSPDRLKEKPHIAPCESEAFAPCESEALFKLKKFG